MTEYTPPKLATAALVLPVLGLIHAGIYHLAEEQAFSAAVHLVAAGALVAALVGLWLARSVPGVLLHVVGLVVAALALVALFTAGLAEPGLAEVGTGLLAAGLLAASWYALQWWIGTQPRNVRREALGLWAASSGALVWLVAHVVESQSVLLADDGLLAAGLATCGWLLRRSHPGTAANEKPAPRKAAA